MRSAALIRAGKTVVEVGTWQSGRLPRTAFPLSRSPIKLGPTWRWRLERLRAGVADLRLLVFFRMDREEFAAWLAQDTTAGLVILARLEDHGTHPGLHLHIQCRDDVGRPVGRQVYPGLLRLPRSGTLHRRRGGFTEMDAWAVAQRFFNIGVGLPGILL